MHGKTPFVRLTKRENMPKGKVWMIQGSEPSSLRC